MSNNEKKLDTVSLGRPELMRLGSAQLPAVPGTPLEGYAHCPLCTGSIVRQHPSGTWFHTIPVCDLQLDSMTGERKIPVEDLPRAVARKLRGVNG